MITPEKLKELIEKDGDKVVPASVVVQRYLPVSLSTLYRLCDEGKLRFVMAGRVRGKRIYLSSIYDHLTGGEEGHAV